MRIIWGLRRFASPRCFGFAVAHTCALRALGTAAQARQPSASLARPPANLPRRKTFFIIYFIASPISPNLKYKNKIILRQLAPCARGIEAKPPAKPRSGDAGDVADSPTQARSAQRLAQILLFFFVGFRRPSFAHTVFYIVIDNKI